MKLTTVFSKAMVTAAAMMPLAGHAWFLSPPVPLLPIPINWTDSNANIIFSKDALDVLDLVNTTLVPRGSTYIAQAGVPGEANGIVNAKALAAPITRIVVGVSGKGNLLSQVITSGAANGGALYFSRNDPADGGVYGLTVANLNIDYASKTVLADFTPKGGATISQTPLWTFVTSSDKKLKYKFPLSISVNETLGNLRLTGDANAETLTVSGGSKEILYKALNLPEYTIFALNYDFGQLFLDIKVKLRKKPASLRPYVPN